MLTAALPPQPVPVFSGFDYVTVDAQRRRVYAAHGGSKTLLVVDADTGKVVGQVRTGPMASVAVNSATGHVYSGNGDDKSVSEVDPTTMKVLRTVEMAGAIDAIAYDASTERIYADEDNGTRVFVIDAKTMKLTKTIVIPGHKPEYLAIAPQTHEIYQNIADAAEIVVIDPTTLTVKRTIPTPELTSNHPLQDDAAFGQIVVAGSNGTMTAYPKNGKKLGSLAVPRFDQCDLDPRQHIIACAHGGGVTRLQLKRDAAPEIIETTAINGGVHTVAIDPQTHAVFTVWSNRDGSGDFVQKFTPTP